MNRSQQRAKEKRRRQRIERKKAKREYKKHAITQAQEDHKASTQPPAPTPRIRVRIEKKPKQAPTVPQLRVAQKIPGE